MQRELSFIIWAAWGIVLVGGCSTGAQLEIERQNQVLAELIPAQEACYKKISDNAAYNSLNGKTVFGTETTYTLEMLSDGTRPSKEEIALLYRVHADSQECRQITLDAASRAHPMRVVVFVELYSAADKTWTDMVSGRLTWGQFNGARKAITTDGQAQMAQVSSRLAASLQNQHSREVEQRQRAAAAFQQWAYQQQQLQQQQQVINAVNRPRTINCNYFGNSAQCSSF